VTAVKSLWGHKLWSCRWYSNTPWLSRNQNPRKYSGFRCWCYPKVHSSRPERWPCWQC